MAAAGKPKQRPAKAVRRDAGEGERRLWTRLRRKQVDGATFRRLHPIHDVTATFACIARKTVVEFDTSQMKRAQDRSHEERRLERLVALGWKVVLVKHEDVFNAPDDVVDHIARSLPPAPAQDAETKTAKMPAAKPEIEQPPETGWQP